MFPIYSRVTINGERIELSTKRSILINNWDKKRQRPKLKSKELKTLNYHLEHIRNKFYVEHQNLVQKGSPLSAMDLKNNLKEFRNKKDYTQDDLGKNVGVSRQTIISIERYRYKPSLELAIKIAEELNVKIEKLFYFA